MAIGLGERGIRYRVVAAQASAAARVNTPGMVCGRFEKLSYEGNRVASVTGPRALLHLGAKNGELFRTESGGALFSGLPVPRVCACHLNRVSLLIESMRPERSERNRPPAYAVHCGRWPWIIVRSPPALPDRVLPQPLLASPRLHPLPGDVPGVCPSIKGFRKLL